MVGIRSFLLFRPSLSEDIFLTLSDSKEGCYKNLWQLTGQGSPSILKYQQMYWTLGLEQGVSHVLLELMVGGGWRDEYLND